MWDVGCGMWDVGCEMWNVECGMLDVGCGMWNDLMWFSICSPCLPSPCPLVS